MSKHCGKHCGKYWVVYGPRIYADGNGGPLIATAGYFKEASIEIANARLIAAAPELLAFAEAAIEYLKHPGGEHLPSSAWFSLNEQGRAAITKAVGE